MRFDLPPSALVLAIALITDGVLGDPPNAFHPVAWLGRWINALQRVASAEGQPKELWTGALISLVASATFVGLGAWALALSEPWKIAQILLSAALLKATFALRGLGKARGPVRDALRGGRLADARYELRSLCSRDAGQLEPPQVAAACIESLAENTSDSFVAPLFYYAVGGLPAALLYRAVNTLDAMIGYRGRYEYFGKLAARSDDVLNWVPARLTAWLLLAGGARSAADLRRGLRVWKRDAHKTESPNAGRPMAVMAGLLDTTLDKPAHYRLGDGDALPDADMIDRAWRVVWRAGLICALVTLLVLGARHGR